MHVYRKLNSIISDTDHDQVSSKLTLFREQMFHKTKLIKLDGPRHNKKLDLSRVSPWNHELTLHTFPACSLYWHGCDVLLSCDFSLCYFIVLIWEIRYYKTSWTLFIRRLEAPSKICFYDVKNLVKFLCNKKKTKVWFSRPPRFCHAMHASIEPTTWIMLWSQNQNDHNMVHWTKLEQVFNNLSHQSLLSRA